ncbi:hypothetical protein [[Clostridium] colinum]|uniref:hypothetical protein n=1 Tax=[Clostridium] colinum TaxID=36835 RepID=UPI0020255D20|nr:hypothetical protein [[Clostridium] colinum]
MNFLKKSFFIMLIFILAGCSKNKEDKDDYVSVQEKFVNMEAYSCNAEVTFYSNNGENKYNIAQQAKNDGRYYIEATSPDNVKGNIILFDGNILWQYNPTLDSKISVGDKDKMARKEICLFSFLENHLKSKDIALETANIDDNVYSVLEAKIPGGNKYFDSEKLWINNETKAPEKLIIYDTEGKERILVEYDNFIYNPQIQDSKFDIENIAKPEEN